MDYSSMIQFAAQGPHFGASMVIIQRANNKVFGKIMSYVKLVSYV